MNWKRSYEVRTSWSFHQHLWMKSVFSKDTLLPPTRMVTFECDKIDFTLVSDLVFLCFCVCYWYHSICRVRHGVRVCYGFRQGAFSMCFSRHRVPFLSTFYKIDVLYQCFQILDVFLPNKRLLWFLLSTKMNVIEAVSAGVNWNANISWILAFENDSFILIAGNYALQHFQMSC